jgi:hypothetical protein
VGRLDAQEVSGLKAFTSALKDRFASRAGAASTSGLVFFSFGPDAALVRQAVWAAPASTFVQAGEQEKGGHSDNSLLWRWTTRFLRGPEAVSSLQQETRGSPAQYGVAPRYKFVVTTVGVPAKLNADSGRNPNGIPG